MVITFFKYTGVNCTVLSCGENEACVKRGDLFYCSSTKDDDDDDLSKFRLFCTVNIKKMGCENYFPRNYKSHFKIRSTYMQGVQIKGNSTLACLSALITGCMVVIFPQP